MKAFHANLSMLQYQCQLHPGQNVRGASLILPLLTWPFSPPHIWVFGIELFFIELWIFQTRIACSVHQAPSNYDRKATGFDYYATGIGLHHVTRRCFPWVIIHLSVRGAFWATVGSSRVVGFWATAGKLPRIVAANSYSSYFSASIEQT
jgi:hypothetical protein